MWLIILAHQIWLLDYHCFSAVARALFPRLSFVQSKDGRQVYLRTLISVFFFSIVLALPFFVFAGDILGIWLGNGYRGDAATVFRILLVGFIFNSVAQICFARIQSAGHAKWTGLVHIFEFIPYMLILYILTTEYSIFGAAFAFTIRSFIDFIILFLVERIGIYNKAGV